MFLTGSQGMCVYFFFYFCSYRFERYVPPPPQIILSLLVIMYICVYSKYCKGCVFFKTGLGKVKYMQVCGCVEWG